MGALRAPESAGRQFESVGPEKISPAQPARFSSRTASRACSSVANGFAREPELASDPVRDTNKSALAEKQSNSRPAVKEVNQ